MFQFIEILLYAHRFNMEVQKTHLGESIQEWTK